MAKPNRINQLGLVQAPAIGDQGGSQEIGGHSMREISPFGLRMPEGLRAQIEREARINGRSLNSEINDRLKRSMEGAAAGGVQQQMPSYNVAMTDIERTFLTVFKKLSPEKQLALISLLK